jgi:hypothetical protein
MTCKPLLLPSEPAPPGRREDSRKERGVNQINET